MASAPASTPIAHQRPAEGEAHELLGFQRVMLVMRLAGIAIILALVPLYAEVNLGLLGLALVLVVLTVAAQRRILDVRLPLPDLRRRSVYLLIADMLAVYVVGTAFVASPGWIGFYFYPLVALEGAVVAGLWGGIGVTVASVAVYLAQLAVHASLGQEVSLRGALGGVALIGFTGGFLAVFGMTAERGRRDMRVLLDLTSAMAHQHDEAETIELLDRRLEDSVGARVRSVAMRAEDGSFEIIRWHSSERRILDRAAIEGSLGDLGSLALRFREGTALTWDVDEGSVITRSLGLPDWARSVTLVPIFVEGEWVAVLPVLWPSRTAPDNHQLRLIYGLANQMGLALSQDQLQRVREEAATDPLTQLMNRRAILDELAAAIARAERGNGVVSVLFCDLDGFKAVNDSRGHDAGDEVLRDVAAAVRQSVRKGDVVGRYGGDELLVVAADTGADEAAALAARMGAAVRAVAIADGVDVTIGISVYPSDAATAVDLLAAADRAMYRGKLRGTGLVVLASTPEQDGVAGSA